jgi:hemoglobin/transferrin/lactoferrin receptor protein
MKTLLVFFLCLVAFVTQGQEITILDDSSQEPVVGVVVYNNEKTKSVTSDLDGKVSLAIFDDNEKITLQHITHIRLSFIKSKVPKIVYLIMKSQGLDEIVISASKFEQSKKEVPQKILSVKAKDIIFNNPQTSADLLKGSGKVYIQKSQLGGGSPMIRGFATNRLLLSIDGVRMNNAIFRGGNVQNVISIDPFSIQNTEIILGSGSIIYGSDAIGGVMNFYTHKPEFSASDSSHIGANAILRYSSASNERTGHMDFNIGTRKWALLTSVSYTDFDDLMMGKHGPNNYLRGEYVIHDNGEDRIVANNDQNVQKFTGYNQINLLGKISHKPNDYMNFDLGLHFSSTSDYPRYDRLILYQDETLEYAEWYYGPQRWFLGNFQITRLSSASNLHDKIKVTAAYQNFQESRSSRKFGSDSKNIREENVDAISLNFDFEKRLSERSKLFYGFEYVHNTVGSKGKERLLSNDAVTSIASRYPDGSTWQSAALYMNYKYKPNRKFTLQSGIRYNHIIINADLDDNNTFFNLPYSDADLNTGAFTGTAGINWSPNETIQWKLNASTAFRAPNIDDIGKIFDSEPGSVVVPNSDLKPEYAYSGELGLILNFNEQVIIDLATYYTYLDNALVRRDFSINGETEFIYDGEQSNVQAIQNASKAWIYGFEVGIKVSFGQYFKLLSQYGITGGAEEDRDGIEVPVRHVAPGFGNAHLIFEKNRIKYDLFVDFNNELSFDQLAPSEIDKAYLYAVDENGNPYAPSWYTLNLRSQYQLNEDLSIIATLENITNQRYRTYSSGIAAPGRNFIVALKYSL